MAEEISQIEHSGIIKTIEGNKVQVSISNESNCTSCHVKGTCSVSDIQEKIVDVFTNNTKDFTVDENVKVYYQKSLGFRAIFLVYLLPFIVLLTTMIIMLNLTNRELLSGLISISSLVPYYFIIYLTKDKIKKTFSFSIKKSFSHSANMSVVTV